MTRTIRFILFTTLFTLAIPAPSLAVQDWRSRDEQADIESRRLWSLEFDQWVSRVDPLPDGLLAVTTMPMKKGDGTIPTLRIIDGESGEELRSFPADTVDLLPTDEGVLVWERGEGVLRAILLGEGARERWDGSMDQARVTAVVDEGAGELYVVKLPEDGSTSKKVRLFCIGLDDGDVRWRLPLTGLSPAAKPPVVRIAGPTLWMAQEDRLLAVDREERRVISEERIELDRDVSSAISWHVEDDRAAVVHGKIVQLVHRDDGVQWATRFDGKKYEGIEVVLSGDAALVRFESSKRAAVVALDADGGTEQWRFDRREKIRCFPKTLVVDGRHVVFGSELRLYRLAIADGSEAWMRKLSLGDWGGTDTMAVASDRDLLLQGVDRVRRLDLDTGEDVWSHEKLQSALALRQVNINTTMAVAGVMSQLAQDVHKAAARSQRQLAEHASVAAKWEDGERWDPDTRIRLLTNARSAEKSAQSAERAAVGMGVATSAWGLATAIATTWDEDGAWRRYFKSSHRSGGSGLVVREHVINRNIMHDQAGTATDVVLVDLQSGERRDIPTAQAKIACLPGFAVDVEVGRIYQGYSQLGLMCKDEHRLDAYRIPAE